MGSETLLSGATVRWKMVYTMRGPRFSIAKLVYNDSLHGVLYSNFNVWGRTLYDITINPREYHILSLSVSMDKWIDGMMGCKSWDISLQHEKIMVI